MTQLAPYAIQRVAIHTYVHIVRLCLWGQTGAQRQQGSELERTLIKWADICSTCSLSPGVLHWIRSCPLSCAYTHTYTWKSWMDFPVFSMIFFFFFLIKKGCGIDGNASLICPNKADNVTSRQRWSTKTTSWSLLVSRGWLRHYVGYSWRKRLAGKSHHRHLAFTQPYPRAKDLMFTLLIHQGITGMISVECTWRNLFMQHESLVPIYMPTTSKIFRCSGHTIESLIIILITLCKLM